MTTIAEVRAKFPQYQDMPDADLATALHQKYYSDIPYDEFSKQIGLSTQQPKEQPKDQGTLKNIGMGALKGAADIGATLMRPVDAALNATGLSDRTNADRRASMGQFFQENANPDSLAFQGGSIGSQIAGTAGVGGALAKGFMGAAKAVPALSNMAPKVATALETGGFRVNPAITGPMPAATLASKVGDAALRVGAGGVTGGAMAGLVNPEDAGTGAVIGAALPPAVAAAGKVGSAIGQGARSLGANVLGAATGTGSEAISTAYKAGKTGATEFLDNMRGNAQFDDIVSQAKQGLAKMREARAADYRSGMVDIKADKTVIDMNPITQAMKSVSSMGSYKGQQINKNAAGIVNDLEETVSNWAKLNPSEYHTPEGLDALKQAIGDIRDTTQFGTSARRAADSVYNAVKREIEMQAPTYAKVMKDYSDASKTLQEVEKALSLGDKASKDTAIRKLQSLMRNNVNTNYGNRLSLAKTLEDKGGVNLSPAIAGQAMSSLMPRGLAGPINSAGITGAAILGNPAVLAAAPFTSPRLMGEAMYGLGRASGGAQGLLNPLSQGAIGLSGTGLLPAAGNAIPMAILANQASQR